MTAYTARAGEKLRAEGLEARQVAVFAHSNRHNGDPFYSGQRQRDGNPDCFSRDPGKSAAPMEAMDAINARFGRETLRIASTGIAQPWCARQQQISPRCATRIDEIPTGRAF